MGQRTFSSSAGSDAKPIDSTLHIEEQSPEKKVDGVYLREDNTDDKDDPLVRDIYYPKPTKPPSSRRTNRLLSAELALMAKDLHCGTGLAFGVYCAE
jgi:hypothetical protein